MQNKGTAILQMRAYGLLLVLLLAAVPVQVSALGPVDINTGMTGLFPWSESGILPGSSNSTFIELHNNGTLDGTLFIWLDNVSEIDPHGSGTALGNYMYLNVSHPRLTASIPLPAKVYSFPTAPMLANYIVVSPFHAGETIRLNWTWEFRETGRPQNEAQGASLRFNISYTLANVPPPTPPTTPPTPSPTPVPSSAPTPIPAPVSISRISSGGGGGGGSNSFTGPGSFQQAGPFEQEQQAGLPGQATGQNVQVSQSYPMGFEGLSYNANGQDMLSIDLSAAEAAGARVTMYPDHIDIYQHHSPGVLLTFWGNHLGIENGRVTGQVSRAEFVTDPLNATLAFGNVSGSVHAALPRLDQRVYLNITISENVSTDTLDQFQNILGSNGLQLNRAAFTLDMQKVNLTTGPANITFTVPASWVNQNGGKDAVRIVRISDETGTQELIDTSYRGLDAGGNMIFCGKSPNGTSLFGLLAAGTPAAGQKEQPDAGYLRVSESALAAIAGMPGWLTGIAMRNPVPLIGVIALLAAIGYFGWRKRRS